MKILVGMVLLAFGLLLANSWSRSPEPSDPTPQSAPLCRPPAAPTVQAEVQSLLEHGLTHAGQRWPHTAFQSAVAGVVDVVNRYGYSPAFVLSLIQAESSFQLTAVSPQGAVGLTQLLPATARAMAPLLEVPLDEPGQLYDPGTNIRIGFGYLASLQQKYGTLDAALAVYNGGPSVIRPGRTDSLPLEGYRKGIREGEMEFAQWLKSP